MVSGMCRRIRLITPAASVSTTVRDTDMVSAVASEVVTASAEQMPRICNVTGFWRISGSVKVVQTLKRAGMAQNSPRVMAPSRGP